MLWYIFLNTRLILCKQSYTRTFDRSYSWALHSSFGPIKCRLKHIKILCKDCLKLSFGGVLKVLLLDKLYRREGCGKPLNRIFFKFYVFNREFFGTKILKVPHIMFLRQKFTTIYIIFDSSFTLSGRKCSVIGRKNIEDGCVGVNMSRSIVWGKFIYLKSQIMIERRDKIIYLQVPGQLLMESWRHRSVLGAGPLGYIHAPVDQPLGTPSWQDTLPRWGA